MSDSYNLRINTIRLKPITPVSSYAHIKKQRHKHYPSETTKILLDNITEEESIAYNKKSKIEHKTIGKIIYKQI